MGNRLLIDLRPAWTPSKISTEAWFDANDASTITKNGPAGGPYTVSKWDDKSGNDNHATQGTLKYQPRWGDAYKINGANAVDFDQDSFEQDQMVLASSITGTGAVYTFMVVKFDTLASGNTVLREQANPPNMDLVGADSSGVPISKFGHQSFSGGASFGTNAALLGVWIDSSLNVYHSVNGLTTPDNVGTYSPALPWKFDRFGRNGGDTVDGLVGEVIVVTVETSEATRQKFEGYLAWKWGLVAELPSDHPYKDGRPTA